VVPAQGRAGARFTRTKEAIMTKGWRQFWSTFCLFTLMFLCSFLLMVAFLMVLAQAPWWAIGLHAGIGLWAGWGVCCGLDEHEQEAEARK
jgi:hypothetical protein